MKNVPQFWQSASATVQGASHIRHGKPNQDAVGVCHLPKTHSLILAVADGHGSSRCFRSDVGAQLAIQVALAHMQKAFDTELLEPYRVEAVAHKYMGKLIVSAWRDDVAKHLQENPFLPSEATQVLPPDNPSMAYGSTLLIAVLTKHYALYMQLGDGDMAQVDAGGTVSFVLPPDPRLLGNDTTSLCQPNAADEWRVRVCLYDGDDDTSAPPMLVMLSTDGYSNSYDHDDGFKTVVQDIYQQAQDHGLACIEQALPEWLTETSQFGSGDDISVALAMRSVDVEEKTVEA